MTESDGFKIRTAITEDAIEIANVHVAAWQYAYKGLLSEAELLSQSVSKRAEFWRLFISDPSTWPVFVLQGQRVEGFASAIPARDEDLLATATSELAAIYLSESKRCMEEAVFRRHTSMVLWVLEQNKRAVKFYKANGFVADGASKYEQRLARNEIRMWLELRNVGLG